MPDVDTYFFAHALASLNLSLVLDQNVVKRRVFSLFERGRLRFVISHNENAMLSSFGNGAPLQRLWEEEALAVRSLRHRRKRRVRSDEHGEH